LAFTFFRFQHTVNQAKSEIKLELPNNPFAELSDMAIDSIQIQWGWALLVVGAALLIASSVITNETSKNKSEQSN